MQMVGMLKNLNKTVDSTEKKILYGRSLGEHSKNGVCKSKATIEGMEVNWKVII